MVLQFITCIELDIQYLNISTFLCIILIALLMLIIQGYNGQEKHCDWNTILDGPRSNTGIEIAKVYTHSSSTMPYHN